MSLQGHFDTRDTDNLFTNAGPPASGTPTDGSSVELVKHEGGIDAAWWWFVGPTHSPQWRSTTPGLGLPCLDFDIAGEDMMTLCTVDGVNVFHSTRLITPAQFTIMIAIYVESATANNADPWLNHGIIASSQDWWGLHVKAGPILEAYVWDGNIKKVSLPISLNTPYFVTMRLDGSGAGGTGLYLSLNGGTESNVASSNIDSALTADRIYLGSNGNNTQTYGGRTGLLKNWNTANADGTMASELAVHVPAWTGTAAAAVLMKLAGRRASLATKGGGLAGQ